MVEAGGRTTGMPYTAGGLDLTPERREMLAPKLTALLTELAKLDALVTPDLEPDTADPWRPGLPRRATDDDAAGAADGR